MDSKHTSRFRKVFNTAIILAGLIFVLVLAFSLSTLLTSRTRHRLQSGSQSVAQFTPQALPSAPTTPIKSSLVEPGEWGEYISETGKFTISYPPNWKPVKSYPETGGVIFGLVDAAPPLNHLNVGVTVSHLPSGWDKTQLLDAKVSALSKDERARLVQQIDTVQGHEATEIVGRVERFRMIEIIVVKENVVFNFWASPYNPGHPIWSKWTADLDGIFHSMVGSFRFLD